MNNKGTNTDKAIGICHKIACFLISAGAVVGAEATTWSLNVPSGTESLTGTVPEGTDRIEKSGGGTFSLQSGGKVNSFAGTVKLTDWGTFNVNNGTWDLQNGTLTYEGGGWLQFFAVDFTNPGNMIVDGPLTLVGWTSLNGSSANSITINGSGGLTLNGVVNPIQWGVDLNGGTLTGVSGLSATSDPNVLAGPIRALADTTVISKDRMTIGGAFSMTDGKAFTKDGAGVLRLCGETSMKGTTWIKNGMLLYANGANVTGFVPSTTYNDARGSFKVEPGATLKMSEDGSGYGTWGHVKYCGVWVTGGSVEMSNDWGVRIGQTGGADMLVSGGLVSLWPDVSQPSQFNWRNLILGNDTSSAVNPYTLTVSGNETSMRVNGKVWAKALGAIVNLNDGGELRAGVLYRGETPTHGLTVNFDGGVFKPTHFYMPMGNQDQMPEVYVHDGGAVIDTDLAVDNDGKGSYSVVYSAFKKPTGKSIFEIGLPTAESDAANYAAFVSSVYATPVPVRISGTGKGASAFLEIDERTCKPVRIVVTGKGSGYGDDTVARLDSPDGSMQFICPITLGEQDGKGSFTKRGGNSLLMYGANTYGGSTIVEGGWLTFAGNDSFPLGSPIVAREGGTFQTTDRTTPIVTKSLAGSGVITSVPGGVQVTERISVNVGGVMNGKALTSQANVSITQGAYVFVEDPENLDESWRGGACVKVAEGFTLTCANELPVKDKDGLLADWRAVVRDNQIVMKPTRGLALIFK